MTEFLAGSVWWGLIDFGVGHGERKKYFVLLTDAGEDGTKALAALTTSKGDQRYGIGARSQSPCALPTAPCFRIVVGQEKCFPLETWVQFDNAHPISQAALEKLKAEKKAGFMQAMADERVRSLLKCAKQSQDIAKRDLERIDQALKSRNPTKTTVAAPKPVRPIVPPELLAARNRIDGFCVECRSIFVQLVGVSASDPIFQGTQKAPPDFMIDVQAGLDLLATERANCASCPK